MHICARCVLPETFPGISFNSGGVCNFCFNFPGGDALQEEKTLYLNKFKEMIKEIKGKNDYDCTLSYSGGKDSTYTLYVLKKVFKLRVLALTLDNGFVSPQTVKNISLVAENLGVDSLIFKPRFDVLKKIFRHATDNSMYSPKTLERASTICTSCIALVKFTFLKIALEKKIPMMAWGWSPGQALVRFSIMKINPVLFKANHEVLKKPMKEIAGDEINPYFLNDDQFKDEAGFPYNISPLAFLEYDEQKILNKLHELGWQTPQDVDGNSTNCRLNSLANKVHLKRYEFHPYAFEVANMVRSGVMSREDGLKKINDIGNSDSIDFAKSKLGL